eukprot:Skav207158  [mRNA]  locus=scaffold573:351120:357875:- [translate_table: standard]
MLVQWSSGAVKPHRKRPPEIFGLTALRRSFWTDFKLSDEDLGEAWLAAQPDYNDTEMPTLHSSSHHHGIRHSGNVRTLYHQTSVGAGYSILKSGFRRGHIGFCGGGIYFALSPQATYGKAVGVDSKHGFIIEARVDLGRVHTKGRSCTTSMSCWARPLKQTIQCLDRGYHGGHWQSEGYDSILFNPGDGGEYMIWDKNRVLSMRRI